MTPTNDELYDLVWKSWQRLLCLNQQFLSVEQTNQMVAKLLAKRLPNLSEDDRAMLSAGVSRTESLFEKLEAELSEQTIAFAKLPKPSGIS